MTYEIFLQAIVSGLSNAAVYALIAVGPWIKIFHQI